MAERAPNHLKQLRESAELTQEELADLSGVSIRTIVYVETEGVKCRPSTKARLLRALGVSFEDRHRVFPAVMPPARLADLHDMLQFFEQAYETPGFSLLDLKGYIEKELLPAIRRAFPKGDA